MFFIFYCVLHYVFILVFLSYFIVFGLFYSVVHYTLFDFMLL